uniref:CUE domain-containing protein n=1 Tax=Panagrellus redivivus TaxID=6233 RepID=A0A7E4ZUN1_PANRE
MVRPQRQQPILNQTDSDGEENERDESADVSEYSRSDIIQYVFEHYDMTPAEIDAMFHTGSEDARNIKNAARKRRSRIMERGGQPAPPPVKKPAPSTSRNTSNSISSIASAALGNDHTGSPQPSSSSSSGEILRVNSERDRKHTISREAPEALLNNPANGVYNLDTMLQSFDQSSAPKKASKIKIFGEPGSTAVVRTGTTEFTIKVPHGQFMEIEF